ncbi:hypothetical protein [Sphingobium sp.]|uniref:hypothetical protein n=1 Tax=Sphingobium sp. TaxID=1912891 RepID=UPI0028BEBA56|nr:hypothetical protein [Sphingobium sp.]
MAMKLLNLDGTTLMQVASLSRDESNMVIKGEILGSMPITCVLTPKEARSLLKMLTPRMFLFLLTFIFRE